MREFEIERQFDLKIEKIKPSKGVYFLNTNKGDMCLKKIVYGIQKLTFIYGAKEHLINNGFTNIDKFYLSIEGEPYAIVNEDIYTLSNWIDGRECNFQELEDVKRSSEVLAQLHIASRGYEPPENSKLKSDLERWPQIMDKRIKSFDRMRDMGRKKTQKNEVDMIYIKNYEFYKNLAKEAYKLFEMSNYFNICKEVEEEKSFCHHDYTYHNIVIGNDNNINILDFDYCKREVRSYDIANYIVKVLKRNNFDINICKEIIESYHKILKLREEDLFLMYGYFLFPQRFWRLSNRYFYNDNTFRQNTFLSNFEKLLDEKEVYMKFLEDFKIEFSIKF